LTAAFSNKSPPSITRVIPYLSAQYSIDESPEEKQLHDQFLAFYFENMLNSYLVSISLI
jgi:hypothetical protein